MDYQAVTYTDSYGYLEHGCLHAPGNEGHGGGWPFASTRLIASGADTSRLPMRMQVRCRSRKIGNGQQEEEVVMVGRFSEQRRFKVVDLSWPLVPYREH